MSIDANGVHVAYRITPGIEELRSRTRGRSVIFWQWAATDDLGNAYEQCGGAFGPSRDSLSTEGVLSLRPLPPPEAHRLRVMLNAAFNPVLNMEEGTCEFDVNLAAAQG